VLAVAVSAIEKTIRGSIALKLKPPELIFTQPKISLFPFKQNISTSSWYARVPALLKMVRAWFATISGLVIGSVFVVLLLV